jgi:hypothetical protein
LTFGKRFGAAGRHGSVRPATAPVSAQARVGSAAPLRWCCLDGRAVSDGSAARVSGACAGLDAVAPWGRAGNVCLQAQGARSTLGRRGHKPVAYPMPGVRADDVDVRDRVATPGVWLGVAEGDAVRGGMAGPDATRTADGEL